MKRVLIIASISIALLLALSSCYPLETCPAYANKGKQAEQENQG